MSSIAPVQQAQAKTCTCGRPVVANGECAECNARRARFVQRRGNGARLDPAAAGRAAQAGIGGGGEPIDRSTRLAMEQRFGEDFSRVRLHSDARAARAARSIGAEAYTIGSDIAFRDGRPLPGSPGSLSLIAHELAHVVQQQGASGASGEPALLDDERHERAADSAAEAVLAGRAVSSQPALTRATVARKPAPPQSRPGFVIKVVVEEEVDGREFCVRAVMQGYGIGREDAAFLLDSQRLHCYGSIAETGVGKDRVGTPIKFRIAESLGESTASDESTTTTDEPEPEERAEINAETDRRFWARIGESRKLSKDAPEDAVYRELWKAEQAHVTWERHDPFGPELRALASIGGMAPAQSIEEIAPGDFAAMMQVRGMLAQLTPLDWVRLRRVGLPNKDWEGIAAWLEKFIAQQRADERVVARVTELNKVGGLDSAYATIHGEGGQGRGSRDQEGAEVYERTDELAQAESDFRAMFQTRAVEKAIEVFRRVHGVMDASAKQPPTPRELNERLYALLQAAKGPDDLPEDVLRRFPILRDGATFRSARNSMHWSDIGAFLSRSAAKAATDAEYLVEHIAEKPTVVFNFETIVNATLAELGLDQTVHARIIREWGKSDGSSFWEKLLGICMFVMLFVPGLDVIAGTYFAIQAGAGLAGEISDYNDELKKWARGERRDKPSPWGVVRATAEFDLSLLPFAHGLGGASRGAEGLLEEGGQIERLATETRAVGAGEEALEREGATAAREGDAAGPRSGDELAGPRPAGEGGAAPAVQEPVEPIQEPVKGGHHVQVTEKGVEVCSPDPCPLLRVEYAEELRANSALADRLDEIDELRATEPARAATQAAELRETLQYIRAHGELFAGLPAQVTPELRARVAQLLDSAEDGGFRLGREQLAELGARLRRTANAAEAESLVTGLEDELERAVFSRAEADAAGARGGAGATASDPAGRQATDVLRSQPGEATGGENLPDAGENWFPEPEPGSPYAGADIDPRVAQIPGQIARRLRAIGHFRDFADFRSTFWRLVADDGELSQGFSPGNLGRMRRGRPPMAGSGEWAGGGVNRLYQLDHKLSLQYGGGLYDLDNIQILSPRFHGAVGE